MKITKSQLVKIIKEEVGMLMSESWADMLAATDVMKTDQKVENLPAEIADKLSPGAEAPTSFVQYAIQYAEDAAKEWEDPSQKLGQEELAQIDKLLNTPGLVEQTAKHVEMVCRKKHQYTEEPWRRIPVLQRIYDSSDFGNHFASIMAEYIGDVLLGDCRWVDINDPGL